MGLSLSALGKAGADAVLLNTGFAAPQLADVVQREKVRAVIADAEFGPAVAGLPGSVPRIVAWQDGDAGPAVADVVGSLADDYRLASPGSTLASPPEVFYSLGRQNGRADL